MQLADVARFCNRYPNIEVNYEVEGGESVAAGDAVAVNVTLSREDTDILDGVGLGIVHAPLYPKAKTENWWLVVGDRKANSCLAIKRVTVEKSTTVSVEPRRVVHVVASRYA